MDRPVRAQAQATVLELGYATHPEVVAALALDPILVVPVGSVEQHGPHLPLLTDALIAEGLSRRITSSRPVVVAPVFTYAMASAPRSGGGRHLAGSVGAPARLVVPMLTQILHEYLRHGFRSILVMNGHMENVPAIYEALESLLGVGGTWEHGSGRRAVQVNWWDLVTADHLSDFPGTEDIDWDADHAGVVETSVLEALAPELVHSDRKVVGGAPSAVRYDAFPPRPETLWTNGIGTTALGSSAAMGQHVVDVVLRAVEEIITVEFATAG